MNLESAASASASPEPQIICRSFRDAFSSSRSVLLHGRPAPDRVLDFARHTASGLEADQPRLDCRFLYDSYGSALFEQITQQPEYYLTRTESSILAANSARVRELTGAVTLVELGSGNSEKTDHLLRAFLDRSPKVRYIPVDVSESALAGACGVIGATHPGVQVIAMNCDYQEAFPLIEQVSPALVMLLGSTIGNLAPEEMTRFLRSVAASMTGNDFFLVGVDLVKERSQLEAAYNDAAGVTANFTRNLFKRMNRELGCMIDTDAIEHLAHYDAVHEQIEIFARFTRQQTFHLAPLDRCFTIRKGEMVRTEICRKFRLRRFIPYLEQFGFNVMEIFTDQRGWCAVLLLRRSA